MNSAEHAGKWSSAYLVMRPDFGVPRIWVDFNNARPDGSIAATTRFANSGVPLVVGTGVVAYDDDGNTVSATIAACRGLIIDLEPDWSSWKDGGATQHLEPAPAFSAAAA